MKNQVLCSQSLSDSPWRCAPKPAWSSLHHWYVISQPSQGQITQLCWSWEVSEVSLYPEKKWNLMSWESVVWGKEVPARWRWLQPGPEGFGEICQGQLPFLHPAKEKGSSEQSRIPPAFGCHQFSFHCVFSHLFLKWNIPPNRNLSSLKCKSGNGKGIPAMVGAWLCCKAPRVCVMPAFPWRHSLSLGRRKEWDQGNRNTMIYSSFRSPSSIWDLYWVPPDLARIKKEGFVVREHKKLFVSRKHKC